MITLRHACVKKLGWCPEIIRPVILEEVREIIRELRAQRASLERTLDYILQRRTARAEYVIPTTQKKIEGLIEKIISSIHDDWQPTEVGEETWREYFLCLLDAPRDIRVWEELPCPDYPQTQYVAYVYSFFEKLFQIYRDEKFPEPVELTKSILKWKVGLTQQIHSHRNQLVVLNRMLKSYNDLLSSSLCSRR